MHETNKKYLIKYIFAWHRLEKKIAQNPVLSKEGDREAQKREDHLAILYHRYFDFYQSIPFSIWYFISLQLHLAFNFFFVLHQFAFILCRKAKKTFWFLCAINFISRWVLEYQRRQRKKCEHKKQRKFKLSKKNIPRRILKKRYRERRESCHEPKTNFYSFHFDRVYDWTGRDGFSTIFRK